MVFYKKRITNTSLYNSDKNLSELANQYETDKGTLNNADLSWGSSYPEQFTWGYSEIYEKYMKQYREAEISINFLEIGIKDPRFPFASTKLWISYFKNIDLYSMDNFWNSQPTQDDISTLTENIGTNFIYGDQGSQSDWDSLNDIIGPNLDFVVEDGSHQAYDMLYSLLRSIDLLKSGGMYFMEDIQNETTRGFYGYNNISVLYSLLDFKQNRIFKSDLLNSKDCEKIQQSYSLEHIHYGGPNHSQTLLACLKRK